MGNLKRNYNRFVLRNQNKGIPNLMLWICGANGIVFILCYLFRLTSLYSILCFDAELILRGQVWRLFTYIFTFAVGSNSLFGSVVGAVLSILFYYWIGNVLENTWGTLRFNIFYLAGILLSDVFVFVILLLYRWIGPLQIYYPLISLGLSHRVSVHYVNLSMFLAAATLMPDQRVYIYMIIPVKMKWMAWIGLGFTAYGLISGIVRVAQNWVYFEAAGGIGMLLIALFPLIALLNYFLFFGRNIKNLFPSFRFRNWKRRRQFKHPPKSQPSPNWAQNYRSSSGERPYRHKCTVCGRTDTDCPDLEFRYCSKCKGYFCYCIDHINNHSHVQ